MPKKVYMARYFTVEDLNMLTEAARKDALSEEMSYQFNHYIQMEMALHALDAAFVNVKAMDPEVARKFLIEKEKEF